jgi:YVTN family beta-propeller protein
LRTRTRWLLAVIGTAGLAVLAAREGGVFATLPSVVWPGKQATGVYLVPTSQILRPAGEPTLITGRPVDVALNESQTIAALLNGRNVVVVDAASGAVTGTVAAKTTSYAGIAFRPGTNEVWASEATRNAADSMLVVTVSPAGIPEKPERLQFPDHAVPAGIAFSGDGTKAYIAFHQKNTLAVVDAAARKVEREIPTGLAPFGVVLSPDGKTAYVTNRGGEVDSSGLTAPSRGVDIPTDRTGAVRSGSVSVIDLESGRRRTWQVGRAPTGIATSKDGALLAVANSHSDTVSVIAAGSGGMKTVALADAQPTAVSFAADGNRIYVACAGTNAIAVLEKRGKDDWRQSGALPTGYFPTAIAVKRNGDLMVSTVKGVGATTRKNGAFNSRDFEGLLLRLAAPSKAQLTSGLREVAAANAPRFENAGGEKKLNRLGVKHVFLVIKENRTYDQVFGDMPRGNNDPNLVMYGREVTPNQHALAEKYVLLDNFYTGGAISFDGHQWLMQGFVSDHTERALQAAPRGYAWNMADAFTVGSGGFFWEGARRPLNILLLGALSVPMMQGADGQVRDIDESALYRWADYWKMYKDGTWRNIIRSRCGVPALDPLYDREFPPAETQITDQMRADAFLERLAKWEKAGEAPNLVVISTTSNHTMGKNPLAPTPAAMVADNDLALGRMVEGISKSRFWRQSLILTVEDDAQDGVDHVDGKRTVALAIGPFIRRDALDSNYYTQLDMIRTIQSIFDIEPRTRYLRAARPMTSLFTTERDDSTYTALPTRIPLDQMNPPVQSLKGRERWAAEVSARINWREIDDVPTADLNRILWWEAKGYDTPYPVLRGSR